MPDERTEVRASRYSLAPDEPRIVGHVAHFIHLPPVGGTISQWEPLAVDHEVATEEAISVDDFLAELTADGHGEDVAAAARSIGREIATREGRESLATLRLARGLTQAELAQALGTSQAYVSRLEAGEHAPGLTRIRELARILDVSIAAIAEAIDD